jgi:hypothetical protein
MNILVGMVLPIAWLSLAVLVFLALFEPWLVRIRNRAWRIAVACVAGGLLGPGVLVGHGVLPVPSALGVWGNLHEDPVLAAVHLGAWARTAALLWGVDGLCRRLLGGRAVAGPADAGPRLLGPWWWLPTQCAVAWSVVITPLGNLQAPLAMAWLALVALLLLGSSAWLGSRGHGRQDDYYLGGTVLLLVVAVCVAALGSSRAQLMEKVAVAVAALGTPVLAMLAYRWGAGRGGSTPGDASPRGHGAQ